MIHFFIQQRAVSVQQSLKALWPTEGHILQNVVNSIESTQGHKLLVKLTLLPFLYF